MLVSYRSEKGIINDRNEDYVIFRSNEKYDIVIITDGQQSVANFSPALFTCEEIANWLNNHVLKTKIQYIRCLQDAILSVSQSMGVIQTLSGNTTTCGLTCMLFLKEGIGDGEVIVAHIGSTRLYGLNDQLELQCLTVDHTQAQELFDNGQLKDDELVNSPLRASLTKYIGYGEPDYFVVDYKIGDRFLLLTDGIYYSLTTEEIMESFVNTQSIDEARDVLIALAQDRQSFDDCTCCFLFID